MINLKNDLYIIKAFTYYTSKFGRRLIFFTGYSMVGHLVRRPTSMTFIFKAGEWRDMPRFSRRLARHRRSPLAHVTLSATVLLIARQPLKQLRDTHDSDN